MYKCLTITQNSFVVVHLSSGGFWDKPIFASMVATRIFKIISLIFHPLLMVTYVLIFLLALNPFSFGVNSVKEYWPFIFLIFFSTFFIPMLIIVMMKALNLVDSLDLHKRKERIAPFIATGIFYGWLFINLYKNTDVPQVLKVFVLGATIAIVLAFLITLVYKVSIHGMGMGGLLAGILLMGIVFGYDEMQLTLPGGNTLHFHFIYAFIVGLLISGLTGTARLYLKEHDLKQWFVGMGIGILAQFLALSFL